MDPNSTPKKDFPKLDSHRLDLVLSTKKLDDVTQILGFLNSIGEYCLILAYKNDRALFLTPLFYLCLVWSTLYGFFFFNELPDIFSIIGTLMLVSAGLLSFYFKKNNLKKN